MTKRRGRLNLTAEDRVRMVRLRDDCGALVDRLADRLPPDVLAQLHTFIFAGEWAELVDNLAAVLVLWKVPVTTDERDALCGILDSIGPSPDNYAFVADRDTVLASLTSPNGNLSRSLCRDRPADRRAWSHAVARSSSH
jgi:hypothetical protein